MTQEERENFYRNSTLIVDHTNEAFNGLLEHDLLNKGYTLQQFIDSKQHEIYHLCYNNNICCLCPSGSFKPQYNNRNRVLYNSQLDILLDTTRKLSGHIHKHGSTSKHCCCPANPKVSFDQLDFTLSRSLLINFTSVVPDGSPQRSALDELVKFRNESYGHATKGSISNNDYQIYKAQIERCLLTIAKIQGNETEVKQKIRDVQIRPLDLTIFKQYQTLLLATVERDEDKMKELLKTTLESTLQKYDICRENDPAIGSAETVEYLEWVPSKDADVPPNAIKAGIESDGRPLYIARALHEGIWYPGKVGTHLCGCNIAWRGNEIICPNYEVLTIPPHVDLLLSWKTHASGNIPEGCVCVDSTLEFYVGRLAFGQGLHPGNIQRKNKYISVPFGGKEFCYDKYEVLVVTKLDPVQYKLFNVCYDLEKVEISVNNVPMVVASQPLSNQSDHEAEVKVSVSFNKNTKHSWRFTPDLNNETQIEIKAGVPNCENGHVTVLPDIVTGSTSMVIQENSVSTKAKAKLPPKSCVKVSIAADQQIVIIPFSAKLTRIMNDNRNITTETGGIYEGVGHVNYRTTVENCPKLCT